MCDGRGVKIKKEHLTCPLQCNFDLCLECASTPPNIDTMKKRLPHITNQIRQQNVNVPN